MPATNNFPIFERVEKPSSVGEVGIVRVVINLPFAAPEGWTLGIKIGPRGVLADLAQEDSADGELGESIYLFAHWDSIARGSINDLREQVIRDAKSQCPNIYPDASLSGVFS